MYVPYLCVTLPKTFLDPYSLNSCPKRVRYTFALFKDSPLSFPKFLTFHISSACGLSNNHLSHPSDPVTIRHKFIITNSVTKFLFANWQKFTICFYKTLKKTSEGRSSPSKRWSVTTCGKSGLTEFSSWTLKLDVSTSGGVWVITYHVSPSLSPLSVSTGSECGLQRRLT